MEAATATPATAAAEVLSTAPLAPVQALSTCRSIICFFCVYLHCYSVLDESNGVCLNLFPSSFGTDITPNSTATTARIATHVLLLLLPPSAADFGDLFVLFLVALVFVNISKRQYSERKGSRKPNTSGQKHDLAVTTTEQG